MTKTLNFILFLFMNLSIILIIINSFPSHYKLFHPLILGSILMLFNIITNLNISMYLNNNWWSYITFLVIVGGLMILFLYFTSFINNMITSIKMIFFKQMIFKFLIMMIFLILMFTNFNSYLIWYNNILKFNLYSKFNNLMYMYNYNLNLSLIISIFYLLMTLMLLVKMIILNKYTLRKIN
uniref:NADH dehydrogenase subunit 6 n=1 Tax=Exoristobia philippinensis TaxID=3081681 RepID=UPI002A82126A|nr:NADH dehydrogenase subunit 6 [Exoristobia philippinensis]WOE90357.1 NADH dehydrogenase subunit 6 [Exoristobia philippinensis]